MNRPALGAMILACSLAVSGCASVDARSDFDAVAQSVHDRTGQRVLWRTGSAEDAQADAAVRELLSREELTADAAVQVALLNNRSLQATYEQLGIAQAQLVRAGLLRNPVFSADAKFAEGGGGTLVELELAQSIGELLTLPQRKRVAESDVQAARFRVTEEVLRLAAEVRRAVVDLQAAQQLVELRRTTVGATDASLTFARSLRAAGNITALELANERALHEQAKLDLADAEAAATTSREGLSALMGLWGVAAFTWRVAPRLPDVPAEEMPLDSIESTAIRKSLTLSIARQDLVRTGEALGPARSNVLLEGLEVGAAGERETNGEWSVGPALSVPLPLFDQGQAAVAIASSEFRAARERYISVAVQTRAEARAAGERLRSTRDRAVYQRQVMLPLRQEILDETQNHYNAMQLGAFQLLQAKRDQVDAAAQYVKVLREYWEARTAFDQIAAGGSSPPRREAQ